MSNNAVIKPASILIPKVKDMSKWSVIACDQFTSDMSYWEKVNKIVGDAPSSVDLILPEVYLHSENVSARIDKINARMREYISNGVFSATETGYVLVERDCPCSGKRLGLIATIDLEEYSFNAADKKAVRASEKTILERIPPRVKIREGASIELPHVLVLIDDEQKTVIEQIYNHREEYKLLYDFELMLGGGRIRGWFVPENDKIASALSALTAKERMQSKYGINEQLLCAVGDGNHSLATAKTIWQELKGKLSEKERESSPARFALVEINNVYDEGIKFYPIHRFIKTEHTAEFLRDLPTNLGGSTYEVITSNGSTAVFNAPLGGKGILTIDAYIAEHINKYGASVDYIHGEDELESLVEETSGGIGIIMQGFPKAEFFATVARGEVLPKKSFSIGHAEEKRYYLEAKYIK